MKLTYSLALTAFMTSALAPAASASSHDSPMGPIPVVLEVKEFQIEGVTTPSIVDAGRVPEPDITGASRARRFITGLDGATIVIDEVAWGGGDLGTVTAWALTVPEVDPVRLFEVDWHDALTAEPIATTTVFNDVGDALMREATVTPEFSLMASGPTDTWCSVGCGQAADAVNVGSTGVGILCGLGGGPALVACGFVSGLISIGAGFAKIAACSDNSAACQDPVVDREEPLLELSCGRFTCEMTATIIREARQAYYVTDVYSAWWWEGYGGDDYDYKTLSQHSTSYTYFYWDGQAYYKGTVRASIQKASYPNVCKYDQLEVLFMVWYANGGYANRTEFTGYKDSYDHQACVWWYL